MALFSGRTFTINGQDFNTEKIVTQAASMTYEEVANSSVHCFAVQAWYRKNNIFENGGNVSDIERNPSQTTALYISLRVAQVYAQTKHTNATAQREEFFFALAKVKSEINARLAA